MSAARESRGQRRYLKSHARDGGYDPREDTRRRAAMTKQANELARIRAQALQRIHLPDKPLEPLAWLAHQLGALARKAGVPC